MTFGFVFLGFLIVIYFVSLFIDWSGIYLFPLVFMMMIMMWNMIETSEERIAQGEYYLKQCQLTEANIDNGFFPLPPINLTAAAPSSMLKNLIMTSQSANINQLLKIHRNQPVVNALLLIPIYSLFKLSLPCHQVR